MLKSDEEIQMAVVLSSSPPPPWIELPGDLTANILRRLTDVEILESAQKACSTWRRVCQDPAMWRVIDMKRTGDRTHRKFSIICRQAVNHSEGQLVALSIEHFGDDELLHYIVNRSHNLRCLQLQRCFQISGEGLAEAVEKLPHLEELHLIIMPSVHVRDIEAIGVSCPTLKSFTFNERGSFCPSPDYPDDDEIMVYLGYTHYAPTIAKTMPNLRHLRLFSNWIIDEGLEAILDGCPHLESLDLRKCHGLYLLGDLDNRCEQIKDLKHPSDSVSDIWWLACDYWYPGSEDDQLSDSGLSDDDHSFGSLVEDSEQSDDDESLEEMELQERHGIWFRWLGGGANSFLMAAFGSLIPSFLFLLFLGLYLVICFAAL